MFINIRTWCARARNSGLCRPGPTWCCMTASADSAAAFCSSCSTTTTVTCFASLQSDVARSIVERNGGNPGELTTFYVVADYQTSASRVLTKSDALYEVVAANRYRLF